MMISLDDDDNVALAETATIGGNSGRGKLVRRRQKEFLENGRISFVVDGQWFGGRTMLWPAASGRFVEGAPSPSDEEETWRRSGCDGESLNRQNVQAVDPFNSDPPFSAF